MILLKLFFVFFKVGLFTFGGGYAMIPLIQENVLENGWMKMSEIINFVAISESTPGPLAINMSTCVGYNVFSLQGAAAATIGVATPSLIVIIMVARAYEKFKDSKIVKGAMRGVRPVVIGLVLGSALLVAKNVFDITGDISEMVSVHNAISLVIMITAVFMAAKKQHPAVVILVSAALGLVLNIGALCLA